MGTPHIMDHGNGYSCWKVSDGIFPPKFFLRK